MKYYNIFLLDNYEITVIEEAGNIIGLSFGKWIPDGAENKLTPLLLKTKKQLEEYFGGKRKIFDLPLRPMGTPFQQTVWKALQTIPYGETRTYQDIAIQIGNEKACRAVGMANNKNPIGIVIPCHRVIGKNGGLTGYAGGLDKKEYLLKVEKGKLKI